MMKVEKQNNPNKINLFWCKANVKRFGFNNLHQDFNIVRIVHTAIDAFRGTGANKMYATEKI